MRHLLIVAVACGVLAHCDQAHAWIFPEHRDIAAAAWARLQPPVRAYYTALWSSARTGYAAPLCRAAVTSELTTRCIDFAAWSAIGGDHSCSPADLLETVLPSDWVLDVLAIAVDVREQLASARDADERVNILNSSNLRLQHADADYVPRAGANNAHFLLAASLETRAQFYRRSTRAGAPLNALGLYAAYHGAAVALARAGAVDAERARRVLALEAYALHFLQDSYSSGHVAGTWGSASLRKGTHDYYSMHGLSDVTWSGERIVMFGDAYMKPADLERAATAMASSLTHLYDAARARARARADDAAPSAPGSLDQASAVERLDSCKLVNQPAIAPDRGYDAWLLELMSQMAVPGYGADSGGWPRFRADFGPFAGIEAHAAGGSVIGGYGSSDTRVLAQLGIAARLGYGLEGVVGFTNSGTIFLQAGMVMQNAQHDVCTTAECELSAFGSSAIPRVPARIGLDLALRLPFWVIPGDLLLLTPVLALVSPKALARVAMEAASGGLIPWQRTFETPIGSFEAVVGRQIGVALYGVAGGRIVGWAEHTLESGTIEPAQTLYRSITLTFPLVEYTPLRTFSQDLVAALRFELSYGIDIPFDVDFLEEGRGRAPTLTPSHVILLHLSLDSRHYL